MISGEEPKNSEKTLLQCDLVKTNLSWGHKGLMPGLGGEKPVPTAS
jgi:hypothetical protein